jgi:hypothetical protein
MLKRVFQSSKHILASIVEGKGKGTKTVYPQNACGML